MTRPLGIAVMGAGLIGKRHIDRVLAEPQTRLAAIIDPSQEASSLAQTIGAPCYRDLSDMLAETKPDGIVIATPNALHVAHGLAAIAAGIPALIEKPIADTVEGGRRLAEASERTGIPLLIGHHRRYTALAREAKAVCESGRLGTVASVHGFFWIGKPANYYDTEWRRGPEAGPILTNLIHDIDLLRWFCGEVAEVGAYASKGQRGYPAEDTAVVILRFESGALGTFNISDAIVSPWNWEQTAGENPAYPHTAETCYHIGGTLGSLSVPRLELWSNPQAPDWMAPIRAERLTAPVGDPLAAQIAHFCRVIQREEPPLVSAREGLASLMVAMAIKEAAASGASVRLAA